MDSYRGEWRYRWHCDFILYTLQRKKFKRHHLFSIVNGKLKVNVLQMYANDDVQLFIFGAVSCSPWDYCTRSTSSLECCFLKANLKQEGTRGGCYYCLF